MDFIIRYDDWFNDIFLFIAVIHLKPIVEIEDTYKLIDDELYDALFKEFEDDLDGWGKLEKETLTVRFREPTVLYDTGSAELKEEFRIILDTLIQDILQH